MKTLLLDAIACPKCHAKLVYNSETKQLICLHDQLIFPVKDDIPVLIETEAYPIQQ